MYLQHSNALHKTQDSNALNYFVFYVGRSGKATCIWKANGPLHLEMEEVSTL